MDMPEPNVSDVELLGEGRFVRLVRRGGWEYSERSRGSAAAMALAITDADEVVLVEQRRVPVDAPVIELPAGLVGDEGAADEDPAVAMARELVEETGFEAARLELLASGPEAPGSSSAMVLIYRATGLTRVGEGGGVAGTESIRVHVVPRAELPDWLRRRERDGDLVDARVWAALFLHLVTPPAGA
ncbi:MAG TPA: NUDIX hydrolase [Gemmatimonadaceae bacterium]|nr:NUDIX hydrolase [Gemmatimonadaceae bacterium]